MEQIRLVILTSDTRMGKVIADEAALCYVRAAVFPDALSVDPAFWDGARLVIIDLDGKITGNIPEQVRVIGICRDPEALSPRARRMVHAVLRRPWRMADLRAELAEFGQTGAAAQREQATPDPACALTLMQDSRCALMGNRRIPLSDKEFAVLALLVQNGDQGVSKQQLAELLDAQQSNEGQVYVCHLRRKLEHAFGLRLIKTVRNWGYKYVGSP